MPSLHIATEFSYPPDSSAETKRNAILEHMKNSADYWRLKACARQQLTQMLDLQNTEIGAGILGGTSSLQENQIPPNSTKAEKENRIYKIVKSSGIGNAIQNWSSALCDFAQSVDCAQHRHLDSLSYGKKPPPSPAAAATTSSPRLARAVGGLEDASVAHFFAVRNKRIDPNLNVVHNLSPCLIIPPKHIAYSYHPNTNPSFLMSPPKSKSEDADTY